MHLLGRDPLAHEPEHKAGVDAARARRHDEPLERREPHGRVDGAPVADRRERRAGAEVAAHEARRRRAEQVSRPAGHVRVRQAVEPVAAQSEALAPLGRHGVRGRRRRQGRMEGRVVAADRRQLGPPFRDCRDRGERLGLMQRRERGELGQRRALPRRRGTWRFARGPPWTMRWATTSASPSRSSSARSAAGSTSLPLDATSRSASTASSASSSRSLMLLDPVLTVRTRTGQARAGSVQSRTSGASSP